MFFASSIKSAFYVCPTILFLGKSADEMREEYIQLDRKWKQYGRRGIVSMCLFFAALCICTQLTLLYSIAQKKTEPGYFARFA